MRNGHCDSMKRGEFFNRLCGGHFQSFARIRDCDIWYAGGFLGRAKVALFLASEDASSVTGAGIRADGGLMLRT